MNPYIIDYPPVWNRRYVNRRLLVYYNILHLALMQKTNKIQAPDETGIKYDWWVYWDKINERFLIYEHEMDQLTTDLPFIYREEYTGPDRVDNRRHYSTNERGDRRTAATKVIFKVESVVPKPENPSNLQSQPLQPRPKAVVDQPTGLSTDPVPDLQANAYGVREQRRQRQNQQGFTAQPYVAQPVKSTITELATWQDIPPTDEWDPNQLIENPPLEHKYTREVSASDRFILFGASVRGKSHKHNGQWRDDSIAISSAQGWNILIACDGAGSAKYSRIGSWLASQAMERSLTSALMGEAQGPVSPDQPETLKLIKTSIKAAANEALKAIYDYANQVHMSIRDFHTTLLTMIHWKFNGEDCFAIFQVGDGALMILGADGKTKVFQGNDHGVHSGETVFLTSANVAKSFGARVKFYTLRDHIDEIAIPLVAAVVVTDGVSDDFFPEETTLIELLKADVLPQFTDNEGKEASGLITDKHISGLLSERGAYLAKWLDYEKKQSFDDRSIVMLCDPNQAKKII